MKPESRGARTSVGAFVGIVAAAGQSVAAPPAKTISETMRFSWIREASAASCPDAAAVAQRVRDRLGRDPFSEDARATAQVVLTRQGGSFIARVRIFDGDGAAHGERILRSEASCDALAGAVALALAIHMDPERALRPVPAPALPQPSAIPPAEPPASPPPAPVALPDAPATRPTADLAREREPSVPPGLVESVSPTVGTLATLDLLGSPAFGATVGVDVELVPRVHATASGLWLPDVRTSDGGFGFGLYAGGAGGCFDVASGRRLKLALCGELLAGVIHDDVYTLAPLPPGGRAWLASRAKGRLRADIVGSLFLELDVEAVVPFVRYEFEVAGRPGMVFHESSVAPAAGLAAGVTFR